MLPWNDRTGRLSLLKLAVFLGVLAPAAWLGAQAVLGLLGAKPLTEAIHQSGDWAVRLLLASLLVTPLRHVADWPRLILVRRMAGLAALGYGLLHLGLYVAEQGYDLPKVAAEIVLRFYLAIGFVALLGLAALGTTSTDGMIRRLGGRAWSGLHRLVYPIAALALLHAFLQSKLDVTEPVLLAGFFLWLMGFRLMKRLGVPVRPLPLAALALLSMAATALLEAAWYAAMTGVMASRVLLANLDLALGPRPALWVGLAGLLMVLVNALRPGLRGGEPRRGRLRPAPAAE